MRCIECKYGKFIFKYTQDNYVCIYFNDEFIGEVDYMDLETSSDFDLLNKAITFDLED